LFIETQPGDKLEKLIKLDLSVAKSLREAYPNVPEDYLSFLNEIGSGEIGNSAYILYGFLLSPYEIYDRITAKYFNTLLIFSDNMAGYCTGFDINDNWSIVEICPTDMSYEKISDNFSGFIRKNLSEI